MKLRKEKMQRHAERNYYKEQLEMSEHDHGTDPSDIANYFDDYYINAKLKINSSFQFCHFSQMFLRKLFRCIAWKLHIVIFSVYLIIDNCTLL